MSPQDCQDPSRQYASVQKSDGSSIEQGKNPTSYRGVLRTASGAQGPDGSIPPPVNEGFVKAKRLSKDERLMQEGGFEVEGVLWAVLTEAIETARRLWKDNTVLRIEVEPRRSP